MTPGLRALAAAPLAVTACQQSPPLADESPGRGQRARVVGQDARPRARDLGVPFDGTPGQWNAITDVPGIQVGHGPLTVGDGRDAVRTGVGVDGTTTHGLPHDELVRVLVAYGRIGDR